MTKSENHNKEYDWVAIQNFYNEGNSYRDIQKTFGCCNATIARSVKCGRLITRSRQEGLKLQREKSPPRKHSQETKDKISEIRKTFLKENPDKVPYRLNHSSRESYPEKIFREALEKSGIQTKWIQEYPFGVFSFDFAFPELKIDLEIDGATHNLPKVKEIDLRRDKEANDIGWIVVRFDAEKIKHRTQYCIDNIKTIIQDRISDPNFKPDIFDFREFQTTKRKFVAKKVGCRKPRIKTKKIKFCFVCNKQDIRGKLCVKCNATRRIGQNRKFEIDKEDLAVLVWQIPTLQIAKKFGVSDHSVAKRCKLFGIVKPPRGYWAKLLLTKK